ncbi:MAG: hypothetical protein ACYTFY_21890 [Planctomycetota bacterium]|jgi:hypothetical protein
MRKLLLIIAVIVISYNQKSSCEDDWFGTSDDSKVETAEKKEKPEKTTEEKDTGGQDWFGGGDEKEEEKETKVEKKEKDAWGDAAASAENEDTAPVEKKEDAGDSWFGGEEKPAQKADGKAVEEEPTQEKEEDFITTDEKSNVPEKKEKSEDDFFAEEEKTEQKPVADNESIEKTEGKEISKAEEKTVEEAETVEKPEDVSEEVPEKAEEVTEAIDNTVEKIPNGVKDEAVEVAKEKDDPAGAAAETDLTDKAGDDKEVVKQPEEDSDETAKTDGELNGEIAPDEKQESIKSEPVVIDDSIKKAAAALEKAERAGIKEIAVSDKITLTTEGAPVDLKVQDTPVDTVTASEKKITTSEPSSTTPVYSYRKDPDLDMKKNTSTRIVENSLNKLENRTNLGMAGLEKVAADLENPLNEISAQARDLLIKAGKDGVSAAAKYLHSNKRLAVIKAVLVIREVGDRQAAEKLIFLLESESPSLRYHANLALKTIFNVDFDFHHNAGAEDREESIGRWQSYIKSKNSAELKNIGLQ